MLLTPPPLPETNIISFRSGKPVDDELALTAQRAPWCEKQCRQVIVDEKTRMLECRHCGRQIDPFDYLYKWAQDGDRRMSILKDLDTSIKVKTAQLEELKKRVKYVSKKATSPFETQQANHHE